MQTHQAFPENSHWQSSPKSTHRSTSLNTGKTKTRTRVSAFALALAATMLAAGATDAKGDTSITEISSLTALSDNRSNSLIQVDTGTFALAGVNNFSNILTTFNISPDGTSIREVSSLTIEVANFPHNSMVQVDQDTFALASRNQDGRIAIRTFTISADGIFIEETASLAHDTELFPYNSLVQVDSDTYALAYSGPDRIGIIKTFAISADGAIISEEASLVHDSVFSGYNSLVKVDTDTYALAYSGPNHSGLIKTFTIPHDGTLISEESSLQHDAAFSRHNSLTQVDSDTFALAYGGSSGHITTFSISSDGSAITKIASTTHDTVVSDGENSFVRSGPGKFTLAYRGANNEAFIKTFDISADGESIIETASLNHGSGTSQSLAQVGPAIFAMAFQNSGSNGVIKTFDIGISPGPEAQCSVKLRLICEGTLSVSCQDVLFPDTTLSGQDVFIEAEDATWRAADTTCLGDGWQITLIADDHLRGEMDPDNHVIPIGEDRDFMVECLDSEIVPIGDAGPPPTCANGPQPVPVGEETPLALISAAQGHGMGTFDFVPHFEIVVPGTAIIDTYTTDIFVYISAGP